MQNIERYLWKALINVVESSRIEDAKKRSTSILKCIDRLEENLDAAANAAEKLGASGKKNLQMLRKKKVALK